jgi:ferredoxin
MPWISAEDCVACGVCIEECPVGAISMNSHAAVIDERTCIRCGKCHDVCPHEAVRHDSERIPKEVVANVEWTKDLLRHFESPGDKGGLIDRMKRYFVKERKVAEQTIERLDELAKEV